MVIDKSRRIPADWEGVSVLFTLVNFKLAFSKVHSSCLSAVLVILRLDSRKNNCNLQMINMLRGYVQKSKYLSLHLNIDIVFIPYLTLSLANK